MGKGVIYGVLAGALWGMVFLIPTVLHNFSPLFITFVRYATYGLFSCLMMLPILRQLLLKLKREHIPVLIKFALTGNILYYILTATAVQTIGVAPTSLIEGLVPVAALFFSRGDSEALSFKKLAGPLVMILTGLLFINADVLSHTEGSLLKKLLGLAAAFAALFIWSWYAARNAYFLKKHAYTSGEWSALLGVFTGALALIFGLIIFISGFGLPSPELTARDWQLFAVTVLFLAIGASWLGNSFWNAASKRLPVSLTGQMIVFETLFALMYGFLYYARGPRLLEIAAVCLLVGGVLWGVRKHQTHKT